MRVWITGYIGSGKSTLSSKLEQVFEFDFIEKRLKDKGFDVTNLSQKDFKLLVKNELKSLDNIYLDGIQCCDYYSKGDKVYFVKCNIFKSTLRANKRDGKKKVWSNIIDNFILFFRFKMLYLKAKFNKDVIKDINKINDKNAKK